MPDGVPTQPGSDDLVLRDARPGDAAGIARMHIRSWQVAYAGIVPDDVLANLSPTERTARWTEWIAERPAMPAGRWMVVARAGGEIVGVAGGGPSRDDDGAGDGEIYALYVGPSHWNRGVGSRLMAEGVRRLSDGGHARAALWVLERNERARRFYERRGWAPDGARRPVDLLAGTVRSIEVRHRITFVQDSSPPAV